MVTIEAPVAVIAALHDEGYLSHPNWPAPARGDDVDGNRLSFAVAGVVGDRAELVPLPGAAHLLAETVESWWGSHRSVYPGQSLILRSHAVDVVLDGATIAGLARLLEQVTLELREARWEWQGSSRSAITWVAGQTQLVFSSGTQVTVTYPTATTATDAQRSCRLVTETYDDYVVLIEADPDPDDVVVWLGPSFDSGAAINEILASPASFGSLPRSLRLPKHRKVPTRQRYP